MPVALPVAGNEHPVGFEQPPSNTFAALRRGQGPHRFERVRRCVEVPANQLGVGKIAIGTFGHEAPVGIVGEQRERGADALRGGMTIADLDQGASDAGGVTGGAPPELSSDDIVQVVAAALVLACAVSGGNSVASRYLVAEV